LGRNNCNYGINTDLLVSRFPYLLSEIPRKSIDYSPNRLHHPILWNIQGTVPPLLMPYNVGLFVELAREVYVVGSSFYCWFEIGFWSSFQRVYFSWWLLVSVWRWYRSLQQQASYLTCFFFVALLHLLPVVDYSPKKPMIAPENAL